METNSMSGAASVSAHDASRENRHEHRRVAVATLIGSTMEMYDFFLYANCVALVFAPMFFTPSGEHNPLLGQIIGFASSGVSFVFRPVGAVIAGHLGDRIGRKVMTVITLLLMGISTFLVGVLPTFAQIGVAAPILLVLLRIMQGISSGGEWGGAALLAVEHAPKGKRGWFGSFPQLGVPAGILSATVVLLIVRKISGDEFSSWGWRIPFLLSAILIIIGLWIRLRISESPVFKEMEKRKENLSKGTGDVPALLVFKNHLGALVLCVLLFMANGIAGNMVTGGFIVSYTTKLTDQKMSADAVLLVITFCSVFWLATTLFAGKLSDVIGRKKTYIVGNLIQLVWVVPMFALITHGMSENSIPFLYLAILPMIIPLGLTYGPQAAFFAEMFPARLRYSGASLAYAFGSLLGSAFAPLIATSLFGKFQNVHAVSVYIIAATLIALVATFILKDPTNKDLQPQGEE